MSSEQKIWLKITCDAIDSCSIAFEAGQFYLILIGFFASFLLLVVLRAFYAIVSEYTKLWYFQGIRPWQVKRVLIDLKALERAQDLRELEFEQSKNAINLALDRAENIEKYCRHLEAQLRERDK